MPHISSKKLDKKLSDKIFTDFIDILSKSRDRSLVSYIVNELFTETEKVMFAKRIAIILLLSSKTPQNRVSEILKVSPSTVALSSLKLGLGKYKFLLKMTQKERNNLESVVWGLMTAGGLMPPRIGKKYWTKGLKFQY